MLTEFQCTDLTNFEAESAKEVMCDVVTGIQLRGGVYVLLKLEPIQNLLLDSLHYRKIITLIVSLIHTKHLELSPTAQANGIPLMRLGVPLV